MQGTWQGDGGRRRGPTAAGAGRPHAERMAAVGRARGRGYRGGWGPAAAAGTEACTVLTSVEQRQQLAARGPADNDGDGWPDVLDPDDDDDGLPDALDGTPRDLGGDGIEDLKDDDIDGDGLDDLVEASDADRRPTPGTMITTAWRTRGMPMTTTMASAMIWTFVKEGSTCHGTTTMTAWSGRSGRRRRCARCG